MRTQVAGCSPEYSDDITGKKHPTFNIDMSCTGTCSSCHQFNTQHSTFNTMKKETWKTIINFIITILTAIASAFCVQSCKAQSLSQIPQISQMSAMRQPSSSTNNAPAVKQSQLCCVKKSQFYCVRNHRQPLVGESFAADTKTLAKL